MGAYGKASISLELLLSTALFVGREGFRLAVTKEVVDGHDDDDDDDGDDGDDNSNYQINSTKSTSNNNGDDDTEMMTTQQQRRLVKKQQIVNVSWLSIPVGAALSILALSVHLQQCNNTAKNDGFGTTSTPTTKDVNQDELWDYKLAGILYCLSSFIEALSEPLVIQCLQRMDIITKAKAEGVALVAKSLCCFTCTVYLNEHNYAVTAFGISQLMYATLFTIIMYYTMIARMRSLTPKSGGGWILWPKYINNTTTPPKSTTTMRSNPYRKENNVTTTTTETLSQYCSSLSSIARNNFHYHTIYLLLIFTLQGIFKHALTEADKFILSGFSDSYDQGVYALVSSYGGLAARLLLQPMEENARLLFSREGARIVAAAAEEEEEKEEVDNTYTTTQKKTNKSSNLINDLEVSYYFFVRLVMYIGLIFAAFGSNYTAILLRLLAGNRWGTNIEACTALSAFCVYTAFLALNGITEAFVYGVARSGKDVTSMGIVHAIVGIVFALFAPTLVTRNGALGLIVANCISMVMRCLYSLLYIRSYFASHSASGQTSMKRSRIMSILSRMFPHIVVMMAFAASFLICRFSSIHMYDSQIAAGTNWMMAGAQHIGVGLLCIVVTLGLSSWFETDMKEAILNVMKRKQE